MLYVVVVMAAVFYVILFSAWNAFRPQIENSAHTLAYWRDVIFAVPDPSILIILKEVIMLAAAYLVFDAFLSFVRRLRHRRAVQPTSWKTYKLPDYTEPL